MKNHRTSSLLVRCWSWQLEVCLNTFDYFNLCFHLFSLIILTCVFISSLLGWLPSRSSASTKKAMKTRSLPTFQPSAWEMLELAKVVYTKQIETGEGKKSEMEEKLCFPSWPWGRSASRTRTTARPWRISSCVLRSRRTCPRTQGNNKSTA